MKTKLTFLVCFIDRQSRILYDFSYKQNFNFANTVQMLSLYLPTGLGKGLVKHWDMSQV